MSKITIQFKPRKDKARNKVSTPIYVTLLFKRKKAEMRMPIELTANELSKWNFDFMRIKENNSTSFHYSSHDFMKSHYSVIYIVFSTRILYICTKITL